jgi:D-alanyl-lipoteichoic acid acyltransferase DltB (MBOAT superfamily)
MFLGGLWHGSSWNFVVWGSLHGILLALEKRFNLIPNRYRLFNNIAVFLVVSFIWIFFRSLSFEDTGIIMHKLFSSDYGKPFIGNLSIFGTVVYGLLLALIFDTFLFVRKVRLEEFGSRMKPWWYVAFLTFTIINIILFYSDANNFIYFQF